MGMGGVYTDEHQSGHDYRYILWWLREGGGMVSACMDVWLVGFQQP